jgi:hypothetical protein
MRSTECRLRREERSEIEADIRGFLWLAYQSSSPQYHKIIIFFHLQCQYHVADPHSQIIDILLIHFPNLSSTTQRQPYIFHTTGDSRPQASTSYPLIPALIASQHQRLPPLLNALNNSFSCTNSPFLLPNLLSLCTNSPFLLCNSSTLLSNPLTSSSFTLNR